MILVKVEVWPGGYEPPRTITRVAIANDGTGDEQYGNYNVWLLDEADDLRERLQGEPDGRVEDYDRGRFPLSLVEQAILHLEGAAGVTPLRLREDASQC